MLVDTYTLRARLQPALVALLPAGLAAFAWSESGTRPMSVLWTLLGTTGFTFLLAMLARNRGKQLEATLWRSWGGPPTTQLLRHSGTANSVLRARWHTHLAKLVGGEFPTVEDELENPTRADEIYAAATRLLIEKRRDIKAYPLIFKENIHYGFCRNLYAMKPIGIFCSVAGFVLSCLAGLRISPAGQSPAVPWLCAALSALLLGLWLFAVRPAWVRVVAFAYAERLLESTEKTTRAKSAKPEA